MPFIGNFSPSLEFAKDTEEKVKERIKHLHLSGVLLGEYKMSAHINQWFISESGLYKLIMCSNKPEAKTFQDWVTKIVIPSVRKDGGYIMGEEKVTTGEMTEDELILGA